MKSKIFTFNRKTALILLTAFSIINAMEQLLTISPSDLQLPPHEIWIRQHYSLTRVIKVDEHTNRYLGIKKKYKSHLNFR